VRDGAAFQGAADVDVVLLDKTGTITEGRPTVTDVHPLGKWSETELLGLAAAVEIGSEHPLAAAVVGAARARGIALQPATGFAAHPGKGVGAVVGGRRVVAGSEEFLRAQGV